VLDGRRGGEVILSNIGSEEATYRDRSSSCGG
jgi:hypothetical protein